MGQTMVVCPVFYSLGKGLTMHQEIETKSCLTLRRSKKLRSSLNVNREQAEKIHAMNSAKGFEIRFWKKCCWDNVAYDGLPHCTILPLKNKRPLIPN